ncbi:MAG: glycosyltransferase family 4 protein [Candidatus Promineifilaceae bacterium]
MKILIFNWRDPTHPWAGGAEVFLYELARRWAARGHQVTWYCSRHPSQSRSGRLGDIRVIRYGGFYGVYLEAPFRYLTGLAGRFDIIVDSANGIPFFTPLYSRAPKVALVHHIHNEVFFRELPRPLAHLANRIEKSAMPAVYRRTAFVTVSDSSRRALAGLGITDGRVRLVHNGVDTEQYRPGRKSPRPMLLFLGRLRHYKSVDVAIRAMPHLLAAVPNVSLHIAGSGPADGSLRSLAGQLGLADRVVFHGFVDDVEKRRLLQAAHVVVNPSMKEGWGLTVLEANACGTPVVGARVPGLCDSICHEETGLLVPYGDPEALAAAAGRLLQDEALSCQMGQSALAWARHFSWSNSADQFLQFMIQLVGENKP